VFYFKLTILFQRDVLQCGVVAASSAGNVILLKLVIEETDISPEPFNGSSALHTLAALDDASFSEGHAACLRYLIQKSNVNCKDEKGRTPLHLAARNNKIAVNILLDAKANIFIKDGNGKMPVSDIPIDLLKSFLDSNIEKETGSHQFYFDFQFINPNKSIAETGEEMKLMGTGLVEVSLPEAAQFQNLAEPKLLFSHPIFQAFISYKWKLVRPLFYLKAVVVLGLCVSILSTLSYISLPLEGQTTTFRIYLKTQLGFFLFLYFLQTVLSVCSISSIRRIALFEVFKFLNCVLGLVVLCLSHYSNLYTQLFGVVTGFSTVFSVVDVLEEHPYFTVLLYSFKCIFKKFLLLALLYLFIFCGFHVALTILSVSCQDGSCSLVYAGVVAFPVPFITLTEGVYVVKQNGSQLVFFSLILFLLITVSHFLSVAGMEFNKVFVDRDYYRVRLQINAIAKIEEFFFRIRCPKCPPLNGFLEHISKKVLDRISIFPKGSRFRLQPEEGNLFSSFQMGKDNCGWWDRPVRMSNRFVQSLDNLKSVTNPCTLEPSKLSKSDESHEKLVKELLYNSNLVVDRLKLFSSALEKLDKKSKEMEDLLIQSSRITNLIRHDDE